jgi:hypothetical protein
MAREFPRMSTTKKRQSESQAGLLQTDPRTVSVVRDRLGEELRAMYGRLADEPLPDRLLKLVWQLDEPHSKGKP